MPTPPTSRGKSSLRNGRTPRSTSSRCPRTSSRPSQPAAPGRGRHGAAPKSAADRTPKRSDTQRSDRSSRPSIAQGDETAVGLGDALPKRGPRDRSRANPEGGSRRGPRRSAVAGRRGSRGCAPRATTSHKAPTNDSIGSTAPLRLNASAPSKGRSRARRNVAATSPTYWRSCRPP